MAGSEATYRFGPFRMEPSQRRLLRDGEPVPLTAKAFDVLLTLVRKSGQLVAKQTLLNAVWPDVVVDESNLTFTISILRKALGEQRTGQRFIETIPKKGYRFVAPLEMPDDSPIENLQGVVERDRQLRALMDAFDRAQSGKPQVRFISGEAGLGKTTLLQLFESRIRSIGEAVFTSGTCIDHKSQAEPYFPIFDALGKLARGEYRELLLPSIRVHAPTWMARMPSVRGEARAESGQAQDRMLRELEDAFIDLARKTTLVIVLEDLQWCDPSTVDVVARVVRIAGPARLLLIGTWRSADARARSHPVDALIRDVCFRSPECLVSLPLLSSGGIQELLSNRFDPEVARRLAPVLYGRTEGNPLFIQALLHDWCESGRLRKQDGGWHVEADTLSGDVPATLRDFIVQQTAALPQSQREVLEAASIARPQSWLRAIAAALERPVDEVEAASAALLRTGLMLRRAGEFEYPNGDLGEAFEFTHALYAEVIASTVPPGRCVRLHQRVGEFLERAFAARRESVAGSLAVHFREARDPRRAIRYLILAARRAALDGAPREAASHLTEALGMVARLPVAAEREEAEVTIECLRGPILMTTDGFASAAAEASLRRALHLAARRRTDLEMPAAFGLAAMLEIRGEYQSSQTLLERYLPSPGSAPPYEAEWHHLLACSTFHQGQFAVALDHALRGLNVSPADAESELLRSYGEHPRVECHMWAALALCFLGFPDQALAHAEQAAAFVETPRHDYAMANGSAQIALLHQLRGDIDASLARAQTAVESGKRQGMPYRVAIGKAIAGWARAQSEAGHEGINEIRAAIEMCEKIGANLDRPYLLALLADALWHFKLVDEAERAIALALEQVRGSRSFFYEAELLRLQGELCAHRKEDTEAKNLLSQAYDTATVQRSKALQLRILLSMVRLSPSDAQLRAMLVDTCALFSEGQDLPDMRSAAALSAGAVAWHS